MTDVQSTLKLSNEQFSNLLHDAQNNGENEYEPPVEDDGVDVPLLEYDEVRIAWKKRNKDAETPRDFFNQILEKKQNLIVSAEFSLGAYNYW